MEAKPVSRQLFQGKLVIDGGVTLIDDEWCIVLGVIDPVACERATATLDGNSTEENARMRLAFLRYECGPFDASDRAEVLAAWRRYEPKAPAGNEDRPHSPIRPR